MQSGLDKHFDEKLRGYESVVDAEAIWEAVRPPRKRRPIWWFWLLLLFGTLGGTTWWWNTEDDFGDTEVEMASIDVYVDNSEAATFNQAEVAPAVSLANESSDDQIQHTNQTATNDMRIDINRNNRETDPNSETITDKGETVKQLAHYLTIDKEEVKGTEEVINTFPRTESVEVESQIATEQLQSEQFAADGNLRASKTSPLPLLFSQIESNTTIDLEIEVQPAITPLPGPKSQTKNWFGQINTAYFIPKRTLSFNTSDSSNVELGERWLDLRERQETPLEAWSADLSVGYQHKTGWLVRAGLGLTQINTELAVDNERRDVTSINGVQQIIIGPEGDSSFVTGPVEQIQTVRFTKRTYNSLRSWQVPLMVGYRWGWNKWSVNVETGLRLLVQQNWEGEVLSSDGEQVLDLEQQDWYTTKLQLQQWQLGAAVSYRLQPNLQIGLGLDSRFPLQAVSTENAPFKEEYILYGVQARVRYYW